MNLKPRVLPIAILVAIVSLLLFSAGEFADDPGVGWHLETGNLILATAAVPRVDPFLFSVSPRQWISDQWLSDCLIALLYKVGEFPLLYAVGTVLFVTTFFGVVLSALNRAGIALIPAIIACFFAFKIAQVHYLLRPIVIAFFLFALLFRIILPIYQTGDGRLSRSELERNLRRAYWFVPILFAFWANLHPSFLIGIVFLTLVLLGFFLDQFFFNDSWPRADLQQRKKGLAFLTVLASVATLFNPYGFSLHESILSLGSSSFFMNYHQEWISPNFSKPEGQMFELILFASILSLFLRARKWRPTMVDLLLICFFVHASFDAVRFLPFFGIVMSPYLADSFSIFSRLSGLPGIKAVTSAYERIDARERRRFPDYLSLSLCSLILIAYSLYFQRVPFLEGENLPSAKKYPYQELKQLRIQAEEKGEIVIAADAFYGGFITWQGGGKVKALIDDRNTLLGEDLYKAFDKFLLGEPGWREYFVNSGATHLMLRNHDEFSKKLLLEKNESPLIKGDLVTVFPLIETVTQTNAPSDLSLLPFVQK